VVITSALALLAYVPGGGFGHQVAQAADTARASSGWGSLSGADQGAISRAVGHDDDTYWVRSLAGIPALANAGQHFTASFAPAGAAVSTGDARWGIGLSAVGHGDQLDAVPTALPVTDANRVSYQRGSIEEWYVNGPAGLEQGFTLAARPAGEPGQGLTLALGAPGSITGTLEHGGTGLVLTHGGNSLGYRGLSASDATGRALPARLEMNGGRVLVQVNDQGAQYPLTVDPFIQTAKLFASDGAANDQLGTTVAISGSTVVFGVQAATVNTKSQQGAAYVFTAPASPAGSPLTQVAKLTASDGVATAHFGSSVAIDGNNIVVGSRSAKVPANNAGAVYLFVQPSAGWASVPSPQTETAKLTASDGAAVELGTSVAVSGDTVVAGAPFGTVNGPLNEGAAYVFVKRVDGWASENEAAKLTASDGQAGDFLGDSVAVSGDTVVAGAPMASREQGAAYVFVKPADGWASETEATKLTASDGANFDDFGQSVRCPRPR
jgi:hypothetical protein